MQNLLESKKNNELIFDLINQLSAIKPDSVILKSLCLEAGLVYEQDSVLLMSKVLVLANSTARAQNKFKNISKAMVHEV